MRRKNSDFYSKCAKIIASLNQKISIVEGKLENPAYIFMLILHNYSTGQFEIMHSNLFCIDVWLDFLILRVEIEEKIKVFKYSSVRFLIG